ncbi:MAG: DUF3320 domain-containing protein [Thermomicrobiales bacterium]
MVDAVARCVEVEGPIHRDLLARRITVAWGHQRARSRIRAHIDEAVSITVRKGSVRRRGDFLWPPADPEIVPREGADREIDHMPVEELVRGMTIVLEHAMSLTEDELVTQTARLFGYQRTGSAIDRRLRDVIRLACKAGTLEAKDRRYQLPPSD